MAKYPGWHNLPTIQLKEILNELLEAKEENRALMIIADTGCGKSNAIKAFEKKHSKNTFVITLGDTYNLMAVLIELQEKLGCTGVSRWKNGKHQALANISKRMLEISGTGDTPILILDEAENSKIALLKAIKELYDAVHDTCSIVLIGTPQLTDQLYRKALGKSIPQLRRRFKAGTRYITPFNKAKDMKPFFDAFIPNEQDLQDLLIQICDNYGELHDYLDPFLKHCDKKGIRPTEEAFRLYHKIPKIKK